MALGPLTLVVEGPLLAGCGGPTPFTLAGLYHTRSSDVVPVCSLSGRGVGTSADRLPTGLKLIAAGELLLDDLRRRRKEHARTLERLDELTGLERGHVRIAIIEAFGDGVLMRTVAEVAEEYPYITFDLRVRHDSDWTPRRHLSRAAQLVIQRWAPQSGSWADRRQRIVRRSFSATGRKSLYLVDYSVSHDIHNR